MENLDKLDRKILSQLDANARQPLSQLARSVRQGRDRVDYRVARLEQRKILTGYTVSVNLYRLGFTIFKCYLRLENERPRVQAMVEFLKNHARIYWVALCDGSWDLMIAVFARSPREFHTILSDIVTRFNEIVLNFSIYTLVEIDMFQKGFFIGQAGRSVLIGGEPRQTEIDKTDYGILRILSRDAREPTVEIARALKTTQAIVQYRIERMEKEGVITGYATEVDLNRLDMLFFKTQFFLRNYTLMQRNELRAYCAQNPYVTCYIEQLGDSTLELELTVHDYEHYNDIVEEIRSSFTKLIRNYQSVLVRQTFFNWVPRDLELASSQAVGA